MPKWLSYLTLIPGLILAIQLAFGWEEHSVENIGFSSLLVFIGVVLMGISQAETLSPSERKEVAQETDISFAFVRLMATALISLCMLSFSVYVTHEKLDFDSASVFWFSLPFLFILLTIKYFQVWRLKKFLYGNGRIAEGVIASSERQINHRQGNTYLRVVYEFSLPDEKTYSGESDCPYSPYISYNPGEKVNILYDPSNPSRNLLLNAWHGKGLQSKQEYYKKLARPDDGSA